MDHKKRERYSKEFRQQAAERMNACDNIAGLSRVLGVARNLLHDWRDRLEHANASVGRSRELILRKQILVLKTDASKQDDGTGFFQTCLENEDGRRLCEIYRNRILLCLIAITS